MICFFLLNSIALSDQVSGTYSYFGKNLIPFPTPLHFPLKWIYKTTWISTGGNSLVKLWSFSKSWTIFKQFGLISTSSVIFFPRITLEFNNKKKNYLAQLRKQIYTILFLDMKRTLKYHKIVFYNICVMLAIAIH